MMLIFKNNKCMKSKVYLLWGLTLALLLSFNACKPKESAYKAAYEAAKAKEMQENQVSEITPVSKPATSSNVAERQEKVTALDGAVIQQYSVVIGSFLNRTNAVSLKDRMTNQGYKAFLALNEERGMYRVIIATFNDRASAAAERDRFKNRYPDNPDFQEAWILDKQ